MSVTGSVVASNNKAFTFSFFLFYRPVQIYQPKSRIFSGITKITPVRPVKKPTCHVRAVLAPSRRSELKKKKDTARSPESGKSYRYFAKNGVSVQPRSGHWMVARL